MAADQRLQQIAAKYDVGPAQIALAWLLKTSEVVLPIPGTKSVVHALENLKAQEIELSEEELNDLNELK